MRRKKEYNQGSWRKNRIKETEKTDVGRQYRSNAEVEERNTFLWINYDCKSRINVQKRQGVLYKASIRTGMAWVRNKILLGQEQMEGYRETGNTERSVIQHTPCWTSELDPHYVHLRGFSSVISICECSLQNNPPLSNAGPVVRKRANNFTSKSSSDKIPTSVQVIQHFQNSMWFTKVSP